MKRGPKSWWDVQQDPRVQKAYIDTDGVWIELKDGFADLAEDPAIPYHTIHAWGYEEDENNDNWTMAKREAIRRLFRDVKPCTCPDCTNSKPRGDFPKHKIVIPGEKTEQEIFNAEAKGASTGKSADVRGANVGSNTTPYGYTHHSGEMTGSHVCYEAKALALIEGRG